MWDYYTREYSFYSLVSIFNMLVLMSMKRSAHVVTGEASQLFNIDVGWQASKLITALKKEGFLSPDADTAAVVNLLQRAPAGEPHHYTFDQAKQTLCQSVFKGQNCNSR